MDEIKGLVAHPADADELAARKAALTGAFEREAATSTGFAGLLAGRAAYDIPLAELGAHVGDIEAVTPAHAEAAAGRLVDPAAADILVAGDAQLFLGDLKKAYPGAEVIKLDALDSAAPGAAVTTAGTPPGRP
jgi:zinc protease